MSTEINLVSLDELAEAYVVNRAIDMARAQNPARWHIRRYKYHILDGPKFTNKKQAVIWHNAFRDECKKIGRLIR